MFVRKRMMVYDAKDASGESFEIWHGLAPEETSMPLATTSRIPTLHRHVHRLVPVHEYIINIIIIIVVFKDSFTPSIELTLG